MWPGRRRKPQHSSDHDVIENVLRCCLHISNAFCGLAACDCADRAVPSSSSCWQQSRRTFADWPGSSPDLHRWPSRLWRKHQVTLGCVQALVQLLRSHRSQRSEWKPKPRFDAEAALAFSHLPLLQQNLPHRLDRTSLRLAVAVGTSISGCPPHRSVHAAFPHTAPTSGPNGKGLPHAVQRL